MENKIITDWLDKYGNSEIYKKVEDYIEKTNMEDEYIVISKTAIQQRIEELGKEYISLSNKLDRSLSDIEEEREIVGEQKALARILSQSTPLIPEIEKAFTKGERYGWDSQKSIGNIDEMKEKIKLQSLDNYISNLKLDI